jgi:hypothetical protein
LCGQRPILAGVLVHITWSQKEGIQLRLNPVVGGIPAAYVQ